MEKSKKSTGSFSKVLRLVSVLEKCNGKTSVGDSDALISPRAAKILMYFGLLLLIGALFAACFFVYPLLAPFIGIEAVTRSLMLIVMLISFVLAIKNTVTVLYTADDLPVLLPMPFSAGQIVTAKLMVSSRFPVILGFVLINSVCLGFGIRMGAGAPFIIGTLLSSVLVPVTSIAAVTLLVVIVFRVFGFIRNRDVTMVLGGVFTLLLTLAYIFVSNSMRSDDSAQAASAVLSTMSSVSEGFPNISFMCRFMTDADIAGLFISIAFSAAVIALAMLAVKLFYFSTALKMQNTGSSGKAVTGDSLSKKGKISALKALTAYEAKSTRRNPAYMIYGFGMSFLWPLFVVLPLVIGNDSIFSKVVYPLDLSVSLLGAVFVGVMASCYSCGLNILAVSAFSREGVNFSVLKAMPIDFKDYFRSKRNFALLICSLGSVIYILILGVFCAVLGVVPVLYCWVFLLGAAISFLLNIALVDLMLLHNSKKPYFTWDSETEISRKLTWVNLVIFSLGLILEIVFMIVLALSSALSSSGSGGFSDMLTPAAVIIAVASVIGIPLLAFAADRISVKKAEKNLMALD